MCSVYFLFVPLHSFSFLCLILLREKVVGPWGGSPEAGGTRRVPPTWLPY